MRARKIDDNQTQVVQQLRRCGVSVFITSMVGKGFPDLVVGVGKKTFLIELKDGNKTESRKKLTPDEEAFFMTWKGHVSKCENVDEILTVIGLKK